MKKQFKILILGIGLLSLLIILSLIIVHRSISLASSNSEFSGWAWSKNIGWISFNCDNPEVSECGSSDYGVSIDTVTGNLSGYAYYDIDDPNTGVHETGWISFNRSDTGPPPSDDYCSDGTCIAKVDDPSNLGKGNVNIKGWARALSACDSIPCTSSGPCSNCGGWDGWIRFDHGKSDEVYIDPSGELHGWAWGGEVIGWISFNGGDPNAGGNYKVSLPLGYASSGNLISVIYDTQEGEGVTLTGIVWHGTMPSGTSVAFELCSSDSAVPASFTCTGPYTSTAWKPDENWWQVTIPLSDLSFHNNQRYIRYKVNLYPDASRSQTPVVDDIIMKWAK